MHSFIIGDARKCIGCQACMIACAQVHKKSTNDSLVEATFSPRITLLLEPEITMPLQCRQCDDAACLAACPQEAIITLYDRVVIQQDLCIGCKNCLYACPFGAIQLQELTEKKEGENSFIINKCDLCQGVGDPACIAICPADALQIISDSDIHAKIAEKRKRAGQSLPTPAKG